MIPSEVRYLTPPNTHFEACYLHIRNRENRVLSDEEVMTLPASPVHFRASREWEKRASTLTRFLSYLQKREIGSMLDIGCGNGWFTAQTAPFVKEIIGTDVVKTELEQAARCFGSETCSFVCSTDLRLFPKNQFDVITFNASIQYFELTSAFWSTLFDLLRNTGEIHILDSPFYKPSQVSAAQQRSRSYFLQLDETEGISYYHHHTYDQLPKGYRTLYRPGKLIRRIDKNRSPFPWIVIRKP